MLSSETKFNILFKLFNHRDFTDTRKELFEEQFNTYSSYILNNKQVQLDDIIIPPPSTNTSVVKIINDLELTEDNTVPDHKCWLVCSTPNDLSTRIQNIIPPTYHPSYEVEIYDNNNNRIYTGHECNWHFIYDTGVLVFENDPTEYGFTLPLKINCYYYTGRYVNWVSNTLQCTMDVSRGGSVTWCSGYSSGSTPCPRMFDKWTHTYWESYNIPSPSQVVGAEYAMADIYDVYRYTIYTHSQGMPSDWVFKGYDPVTSTWLDLDTHTGESLNADDVHTFELPNAMSISRFRIEITGTSDGNRCRIRELLVEAICPEGRFTFNSLYDTPSNYIDADRKILHVSETNIEYATHLFYDETPGYGRVIINDTGRPTDQIDSTEGQLILSTTDATKRPIVSLQTHYSGGDQRMGVECWREGVLRGAFMHWYGGHCTGLWDNTSGITYQTNGSEPFVGIRYGSPTLAGPGSVVLNSRSGRYFLQDRGNGYEFAFLLGGTETKQAIYTHYTTGYGVANVFLRTYPRSVSNYIYDHDPSLHYTAWAVWQDRTNVRTTVGIMTHHTTSVHESVCFIVADNTPADTSEIPSYHRRGVVFPKMTTTERDNIPSPVEGLLIYNTDSHTYQFYNGSVWTDM